MYSPNYLPNFWLTNPLDGPIINWDEMSFIDNNNLTEEVVLGAAELLLNGDFSELKDIPHTVALFDEVPADLNDTGFEYPSSIENSSPSTICGDLSENEKNEDVSDLNDSGFEESPSFIHDSSPATIYSNPENVVEHMDASYLNDSGCDITDTVLAIYDNLTEEDALQAAEFLLNGDFSELKDPVSVALSSSETNYSNAHKNVDEHMDVSDLNDSGFDESASFVDDSVEHIEDDSGLNDSGFEESASFTEISSSNRKNVVKESLASILDNSSGAQERLKKMLEGEVQRKATKVKKYVIVKKSSLSYVQMVFLAMYNSPVGIVPLKEIYQCLSDYFTSLRGNTKWYNTVRHTLSNKEFFEKVMISNGRKSAYRVLNISIFNELKKSVQQVIKNRGFESLGMETKAPIERIYDENPSFMMNEVAEPRPIINIAELPPHPFSVDISTDLFFALREHSFDMEVDQEI